MAIGSSLNLSPCRRRRAPVATAQAVAVNDMVAVISGTIVRPEDVSWGTAHTAPSAPTLADGSVALGTALTNAVTGVLVTAQFPWGEAIIGTAGTVTPTAGRAIKCTLAALPTYALYWNIYVETAAGSTVYKLWRGGFTGAQIVYIDAYGAGQVPYACNPGGVVVPTGALEMTQYAFVGTELAPQFLGLSHETKAANVARPYGGSEDNQLQVNVSGTFPSTCASATFAVGDYVGPAKQSGNLLESQKLVAVCHPSLAIGRVIEVGSSVTTVKFEVLSALAPSAR